MNLRKPYSGTTAQINDKFQGYLNYFKENASFNFINDFFHVSARFQYEHELSKRFGWNVFYDFKYLHLTTPRNLKAVYECFGTALTYKFGSYGKK
jgi:hypothetical protein